MNTYKITYNHKVFKPSNYDTYKKQQAFTLTINAASLEECKAKLRSEHNKNPFYFSIDKV